mmetsp:Transcript_21806/g.64961  ORF Transcript_21806/g.64961 Transcript_21806/m.64961 type:complete len:216 (-) Transcript_21806:331-978(-)
MVRPVHHAVVAELVPLLEDSDQVALVAAHEATHDHERGLGVVLPQQLQHLVHHRVLAAQPARRVVDGERDAASHLHRRPVEATDRVGHQHTHRCPAGNHPPHVLDHRPLHALAVAGGTGDERRLARVHVFEHRLARAPVRPPPLHLQDRRDARALGVERAGATADRHAHGVEEHLGPPRRLVSLYRQALGREGLPAHAAPAMRAEGPLVLEDLRE